MRLISIFRLIQLELTNAHESQTACGAPGNTPRLEDDSRHQYAEVARSHVLSILNEYINVHCPP